MKITALPTSIPYLVCVDHSYIANNQTLHNKDVKAVLIPDTGIYEGEKPGIRFTYQIDKKSVGCMFVNNTLTDSQGKIYRVLSVSEQKVPGFDDFFEGDCKLDKTV